MQSASTPAHLDETSPRYFGWRVVFACFLFAGALGPGLIGLIRASTGDHGVALTVCLGLKIVGGAFVLIRGVNKSLRGISQ